MKDYLVKETIEALKLHRTEYINAAWKILGVIMIAIGWIITSEKARKILPQLLRRLKMHNKFVEKAIFLFCIIISANVYADSSACKFTLPDGTAFENNVKEFGIGELRYKEFSPTVKIFTIGFKSNDLAVEWESLNTQHTQGCGHVDVNVGYGIRFTARQLNGDLQNPGVGISPDFSGATNYLKIDVIGIAPIADKSGKLTNGIFKFYDDVANHGAETPKLSLSLTNDQILSFVDTLSIDYSKLGLGTDFNVSPQIISFYLKDTGINLPLKWAKNGKNVEWLNTDASNWGEIETAIDNSIPDADAAKSCDGTSRGSLNECKVEAIVTDINDTLNKTTNKGSGKYPNATFLYRLNTSSFTSTHTLAASNGDPNSSKFFIKYSRRPDFLRWSDNDIYAIFSAGSSDVDVSGITGSIASILLELGAKYQNANVYESFHKAGKVDDDRVTLGANAGATSTTPISPFSIVKANVTDFISRCAKVNDETNK